MGCKAAEIIDTIEELLQFKPAPTHLCMDNGPEFITNAEHEWSAGSGCSPAYISPGSPFDNSFVESFTSRYKNESLNSELFISVQGAKLLSEQHRIEYCTYRPY